MKPNKEQEPSVVQGTEQEFAEITAGIQMTMILRMANSFNVPVYEFSADTSIKSSSNHDLGVKVSIKTDERGAGDIRYVVEGYPEAIWKVGGVYAYRTPDTKDQPSIDPLNLLIALNQVILQLRSKITA